MTQAEPNRARWEDDEFGKFALRIIRAYGRRAATADPDVLADLNHLHDEIEKAMDDAVAELRRQGVTWALIGEELGVTRQAAFLRWGRK